MHPLVLAWVGTLLYLFENANFSDSFDRLLSVAKPVYRSSDVHVVKEYKQLSFIQTSVVEPLFLNRWVKTTRFLGASEIFSEKPSFHSGVFNVSVLFHMLWLWRPPVLLFIHFFFEFHSLIYIWPQLDYEHKTWMNLTMPNPMVKSLWTKTTNKWKEQLRKSRGAAEKTRERHMLWRFRQRRLK